MFTSLPTILMSVGHEAENHVYEALGTPRSARLRPVQWFSERYSA